MRPLLAAIFLSAILLAIPAFPQGVSKTAPVPNRNISAPSPHRPTGGDHPESTAGTVEGFVYWDTHSFTHVPAGSCSGLSLTVSVGSSSGSPLAAYTPLTTISNDFKYVGQVKEFLAGGKVNVYDVCTYGYDHVPVGPDLQVKLAVTQQTAFSPAAVPQFAILGPIKIINAQCNMLPRVTNPTPSDLTAHWGSCQNVAYDVNFVMHSAPRAQLGAVGEAVTSGSSASQRVILSNSPQQGMLAGARSPAQLLSANGGQRGNTGSTPSASVAPTPGSKVELNPQPLPPRIDMGVRPAVGGSGINGSGKAMGAVTPGRSINQVRPPANRGAAPTPTHLAALGVSTPFNPKFHGFRFVNDFQNDVVPAVDVRTGGLCGGMSYAALDYYFSHTPIPQQQYRPANRTTLQSYLYNRETESLVSNLDKWAEVGFNPGGARNGEFFNWGLQGQNGGRLEELRSFLDQGIPAVMDMQGDGGTGNHQVVAIGYNMGRYQGDLGNFEGDLKITVYDPNYPMQVRTLVPDISNQLYRYAEGGSERWRTYFVDKNYHSKTPPNLPNPTYPSDGTVRELVLSFHTGADDLRGGNDNINLTLDLTDGGQQFYPNINLSARWLPNYTENARIVLSTPLRPEQIRDLIVADTFGGGFNGDNWDMSSVTISELVNGKIAPVANSGFHRFSADSTGPKAKSLTIGLN
jgi:hypothetical protein